LQSIAQTFSKKYKCLRLRNFEAELDCALNWPVGETMCGVGFRDIDFAWNCFSLIFGEAIQ
jgi:hypothetical protein